MIQLFKDRYNTNNISIYDGVIDIIINNKRIGIADYSKNDDTFFRNICLYIDRCINDGEFNLFTKCGIYETKYRNTNPTSVRFLGKSG